MCPWVYRLTDLQIVRNQTVPLELKSILENEICSSKCNFLGRDSFVGDWKGKQQQCLVCIRCKTNFRCICLSVHSLYEEKSMYRHMFFSNKINVLFVNLNLIPYIMHTQVI